MDYVSPCIRCGKPRIVAKTWQETIQTANGKTVITQSVSVCPDPACQKIVDEKFAQDKIKSDEIKKNFADRAAQRMLNSKAKRSQLHFAKAKG